MYSYFKLGIIKISLTYRGLLFPVIVHEAILCKLFTYIFSKHLYYYQKHLKFYWKTLKLRRNVQEFKQNVRYRYPLYPDSPIMNVLFRLLIIVCPPIPHCNFYVYLTIWLSLNTLDLFPRRKTFIHIQSPAQLSTSVHVIFSNLMTSHLSCSPSAAVTEYPMDGTLKIWITFTEQKFVWITVLEAGKSQSPAAASALHLVCHNLWVEASPAVKGRSS